MPKQLNQAHIELKAGIKSGQDKVAFARGSKAEWLNVYSDKPNAKLVLKVKDEWGNIVIQRDVNTGESKNFGERVSLDLTDSYYNVEVEDVTGADQVDVFLD